MSSPVPRELILNVDDNASKRYVKTRILTGAGYDVLGAGTAAEAREAILQHHPDLILLDVHLPDSSGREVCSWVKATPEIADIVVLQTSAYLVDPMDKVASLDAGADGFLIEPFEPEELVATVRALLRMRRAESERRTAMRALQEADRRKDEFLAMLAHELRNPLAPIRNAAEIVDTDDRALRQRARLILRRQVDHLARLVDDLLDVSRITQRKVVLQRSRVTLATVVEAAVETARPLIERERHQLSVRLPPAAIALDIDAVRISQVIANLLNNAAKFTPAGGRIALEARRLPEALEIQVRDNGIGIASESLDAVFDLFTQDQRSLERSRGGLGIGLSLVRRMVELHGGTVKAESPGLGQGSVFTIRLPLDRIDSAREAPSQYGAGTGTDSRRILVVEDNCDAAETMRLLLQTYGHEVSVAGDATQAIDTARRMRPEVVLMDIGLPGGMSGFELAYQLRRQPETRDACLIAVSGFGQESDRARSVAAGFDHHLTKPVEPGHLCETIELLSHRPTRAAAAAAHRYG